MENTQPTPVENSVITGPTTTQPVQPLQPTQSTPAYKLDKADLSSIGKGLLVAVAGAALTYLNAVIFKTDFTVHVSGVVYNFAPVAYIVWSGVANAVRKYFDGV